MILQKNGGQVGKTISHYKILAKLGEGGMGVVYKAEDTKLKRTVALKFLTPQAVGSEEEKSRFLREAQAAAALDHPNICTVYEIDEAEGQTFIGMAYIEGETLKDKIEPGPLKLDEAMEIAIQVSEGLQKAHGEGVVHRDIKSANIMVTKEGQAKIMDFGLAKLAGRTKLTKTGTTVGTVAYMSPEQARGEAVDNSTDIWSLGVVLYEMVTGQLPFKGDYDQAVMYSIMNEEPEPITGLRTGVPMELERITNKALAKSPDERYLHVDQIEADLKILRKELETPARIEPSKPVEEEPKKKRFPKEPEKRPFWRLPAYALAVLILVVAGVIFYSTIFKEPSIPVEYQVNPKSVAVLPFTTITRTEEDEIFTDGIHDDILTQLAKIRDIKVIARTSVMKYRNTDKRISEIGKELGVASILEGSVRRAGGRIRIVSQLVDVKTDEHLWAETYDRDYSDVFAIQSDVAQRIASALKATLTVEEKSYIELKPTENLEAYDYYLKGNHYWNTKVTKEGNLKAAEMYEKAIKLDPDFALAYARLSIVNLALYSVLRWDHTQERLQLGKSALDKARELSPDLPDVHLASGIYYGRIEGDYDQAVREYEIAHQARPNDSEIVMYMAGIFRRQGKWDKAEEYALKADDLDPQNAWNKASLARHYSFVRKWAEAERYAGLAVSLNPEMSWSYEKKAGAYIHGYGDLEKARGVVEDGLRNLGPGSLRLSYYLWLIEVYSRNYQGALEALESNPEVFNYLLKKGRTYLLMGDEGRAKDSFDSARVVYEELVQEEPGNAPYHSYLGMAYAGLGRKDEAILHGEKAVELLPISKDASRGGGPDRLIDLASIYISVREYDLAVDQLELLLSIPSDVSKWTLRMNPVYDPLRSHPGFQKLVAEG